MLKASRGEPLTIGFIGGSITYGEGASSPEHSYAHLVTQWWSEHFPRSAITMVNAGVPGTASSYGVFRLQRDLLSRHPDVVIVEYGVNDPCNLEKAETLEHAQTYEGIIRQLLADPGHPAILQLFLMHHDGTSAQNVQASIGTRYDLPMISYRDALWPEIEAGRLKWSDITRDAIHPNDRGHAAAALFIDSLLQQTLDHLPPQPPTIASVIPAPVYTSRFDHTALIEAEQLKPTRHTGWVLKDGDSWWYTDQPGSVLEFSCNGSILDLLYAKVTPDAGCVDVSVDDQSFSSWNAWFDGTWNGYVQADEIYRGSGDEPHRVRVQLLDTHDPLSHGYEFRIVGLGVAK